MFRLIKWAAVGTLALGGFGFFLFGDHVTSYLGTAASSIREGVTERIPVDFELRRAERLIQQIDPELLRARREVAQAEVDLSNLQREIEELETKVDRGEQKLRHVSSNLGAGAEPATQLAGYPRARVEMDLERTFDAFRNHVALLRGKRAQIERQTRAVAAARAHLDAVLAEKARLEDLIGSLKTQKRQLDALATSSRGIRLDDSVLGQAREVLDEVKNRLDVAQRMLEDEVFVGDEIDAGARGRDIAKEIREYFDESAVASGQPAAIVEVR